MRIGVPREVKQAERRVGLTPASVRELTGRGHEVLVESEAGAGIGATDDHYEAAGAMVIDDVDQVWDRAEMIVKVKEPQSAERARLCEGQILFTYLHLAPDHEQSHELIASQASCIAYERLQMAAADYRCWPQCLGLPVVWLCRPAPLRWRPFTAVPAFSLEEYRESHRRE